MRFLFAYLELMAEATASDAAGQQIFISYSRSDHDRVEGLCLLLEALGHNVFFDKNSIKPGMRWKLKLKQELERADKLLVYWSKHARDSSWVRKEYEYFYVHFPDRAIVPILGDETALPPLLESHFQRADFSPIVNELLVLKRNLEGQGIKPPQIQEAILKRLHEAGIEISVNDRHKLFRLFAPVGFLALLSQPLVLLPWLGRTGWEAAAQLSGAQVTLIGAAAVAGVTVCQIIEPTRIDAQPATEHPAGFHRGATVTPPVLQGFDRGQSSAHSEKESTSSGNPPPAR